MKSPGPHRIQAVSELTGVPAPTLRAWERRYGVPSPSRSQAAYRLYDDADVETILRMRDLIEQGLAAAEAARMVREGPWPSAPVREAGPWEQARGRILSAVEAFDPEALEEAVRSGTFLGSAAAVFEGVFRPALIEVGERWSRGRLSVGQEHLATDALERATRELLRLVQPGPEGRLALLACAAEELHSLAPYGVALRLTQWGWRTVVLGARTPPEALAHAVRALAPDLVGISFTVAPEAKAGRRLIAAYAKAAGSRVWAVGGAGSARLEREVKRRGGLFAGIDVEALKPELERALALARRR